MDKVKTFVGQPILAQIISCIPKNEVELIAKAHQSNRYYKKIPLQTHLTTLLYGVLSCCNGLREICEGMLVCEGSSIIWDYKKHRHEVPYQMRTITVIGRPLNLSTIC